MREQRAYNGDSKLTGIIVHHVPWTPGEMNIFLNSITKTRHSPYLSAKQLCNIATSYKANWEDILRIIKGVSGISDADLMIREAELVKLEELGTTKLDTPELALAECEKLNFSGSLLE